MRACLSCLFPLLTAVLAAQAVVIPGRHAERDAPGLGDLAGFSQPFRQQIVLRPEELAPLRGKEIAAVWVRRDTQLAMPLRPGKADLTVIVSAGGPHPTRVSERFASNHGEAPVEVFRGRIDLPAAPMPTGPTSATWGTPTAVEIKFSTPFRYTQGSLCIELQGRPLVGQQTPAWPVDIDIGGAGGSMLMLGRTADQRLQAMAVCRDVVPGAEVTLFATGPAETNAVCLFGSERKPALDLAGQGAPNCALLIEPWQQQSFLFPRVKADPVTRIEHHTKLPSEPCLLGAQVGVQWLQFPFDGNALRLATTHAQMMRLANGMPAFPGVMVRTGPSPGSTFADVGQVVPDQMPVLRLVAR